MLKHEYATVNGLRLHFVTAGKGQLLLFLHGFPEFWYAWKNQLVEFADSYQCVALDLPGFNLSEKPAEVSRYQAGRIAEHVRGFARHLSGGRKFILAGHDWGGYLGWVLGIAHPEELEKLVIVNARHPAIFAGLLRSDPAQQNASKYMEIFRSAQAEAVLCADGFASLTRIMAFGEKNGLAIEDKPAYIEAWSQPGAITGGLNYYRANELSQNPIGDDALAESFKVDVPTLVIWGMNDPTMMPANLNELEKYIPQLTIERIADASHWLVHTHAAEVNHRVRAHLG